MTTIDDFSNIKISTSDLLVFQRELIQEKELLQNILAKIDDQISSLQVEQLHLLGLINKLLKGTKTNKSPPQSTKYQSTNDNQQDSTSKLLDLAVPSTSRYYEEEMEDEDD